MTKSSKSTVSGDSGGFREGAWNREGVILFGAAGSGLWQVSEAGGTPSLVTKVDPSRREVQHAGPTFLPDGRRFLYHRGSATAENRGIYLGSLDATPEEQSVTRFLAADSDPVYVPSPTSSGGSLMFLREGTLLVRTRQVVTYRIVYILIYNIDHDKRTGHDR